MPRPRQLLAMALGLAVMGAPAAVRAQSAPDGPAATRAPAHAAAPAGRTAAIGRPAALFLIRSVLLALHQANQTGNYTVLRDISAPDFARANTAARLADIFAPHRDKGVDLSEIAVVEPDLEAPPEITAHGHLRLAGEVGSVAHRIAFELVYAPVEGRWRLAGIATNVTPAQTEASRPRPEGGKPPALRATTVSGPPF